MSSTWLVLTVGLLLGFLLRTGLRVGSQLIPGMTARRRYRQRLQARRLERSAQRLSRLVHSVSGDVEQYRGALLRAGEELSGIAPDSPQFTPTVLNAAIEIVQLNRRLHGRLNAAEERLRAQRWQLQSQIVQARTDPLTGLPNRRVFDQELKRRFVLWQRRRQPFSLVLLDIDHFKELNDYHGHPAGDAVLVSLADTLQRIVREMDIPIRVGGEEFVVILPDTETRGAALLAERIRRSVAKAAVGFEGVTLTMTVSCGAAAVGSSRDADELFKWADEALYAAKEHGRNRVYYRGRSGPLPYDDRTFREEQARNRDAAEDLPLAGEGEAEMQVLIDNLQARLAEIQ